MSVSRLRETAVTNKLSFAQVLKSFVTNMITEHKKEIIIIDDLVYVMTQSFMKNIADKGWKIYHALIKLS